MRFKVVCTVSGNYVPIDYHRKVVSMLKKGFEQTAPEKYQELYGNNTVKDYTFSVYFGQAIFEKKKIILTNNQVILNFSTANAELGFYLYNVLMSLKKKENLWDEDVTLHVQDVQIVHQAVVIEDQILLKALSPIVCRNHNKETNKDWYYSFENLEFLEIIKRNMISKLVPILGEYIQHDIEELSFEPVKMKKTVVRFYERQIECSIGQFYLKGKPHLLNYLMQSGVGSLTGSGFGMCELV
ncbi:CRISPR-associated endoribonuclease Cas6 [Enterococcus sp. LJL128]